ncbi:hypothetical protein PBI_DAMIEN_22 [Mycobacterium phage Damien]|uniref:hypothetical protein n=1 Tax=Mycobacterium phage Oaker TaxID=1445727 RepID=UPI0003E340FD|nr:hypothetical protein CH12_gp22 [Mycobacterium phage Oaker]YP_009044011.1 hypothetical protein HL12_gp22 [Mycobacterium phage Damien]AHG24413.1 hypothetical protein PBI_OAKER_22 [Mycobacterium phage Oaker]AHZ95383.1 hypothetical protein PBI_DAMIEN_22 [Mycobacterium phage Damien]
MADIRCSNKKHGEVTENSTGELRMFCRDRFCKIHGNEVVQHVWDLAKVSEDGSIRPIETKRFKKI